MTTKNKEATISFIVPCYNDADTIEKMVLSVRDQDLPNIEIIAINDGSTDKSKEVLENLKSVGLIDKFINFEKNKGACIARNKGAKVATGKYLAFLPADAILYAGMARIWHDTLEDFPEYDFMYGGYRFIDEDGEPLEGQDYMGGAFDPYLLEVTNYIDGSFPIRREKFWEYAKKMNQPDGLWDSKIKSLQDWDYWLSVVKNGGKGVFVQDIFFGTTIPHKGGLSYDSAENWLDRTNAIKKKHGIPKRKLCVASLGAGFHAKRLAYILGADYKEMPSFKPHEYDALYSIGFYPQFGAKQDQMFFNNLYRQEEGRTPAKKIVHFVGTDVWQLFNVSLNNLKVWRNYFKNAVDEVLCESDFIQDELKELGIDAKIVPLPPAKLYKMQPLPKDFTVACYMPAVNRDFYRPKEMQEIVKKLPDVKFKFFGNPRQTGEDPALGKNCEYMGYVHDMEGFIKECSAIMRFPQHDGLPISVLEFILAGRHSLQSVPIYGTLSLKNFTVKDAVDGIKKLKEMCKEGQNKSGSDHWRKVLNHSTYRKTMKKLSTYDPKSYWENRARSWSDQAREMKIEVDEVQKVFKEVNAKDVVDVGCGDARWYTHLKEWGVEKYKGIDISQNLIGAAQLRFPHEKDNLETIKVEDYKPEKKHELIFSYTCFEHITAKEWPKAVKALKAMGKKLLLIEPMGFPSRYYCHDHPYEKNFKVLKKVKLKDKTILLCDLK